MIYLTSAELLYVARRAIGTDPDVRDYGLLESAAARPQATAATRSDGMVARPLS